MQALVTHVLGARPNFMKAAPVIRVLGEAEVDQAVIHTGQHYDARMSDVFFADLETNPAGYYQGAVYHGAIQLLLEPTGRKMTGKWVGFGRDFDLNTGPWTLELVTGTVTEETLREYSKSADTE